MLRRLYSEQPESFAFTPENRAWAEAQITKYPEGRQASAVIALLWRAQEQEGWLTRAAIEHVSDMLGMDYIRALEVATFYFMFQLKPVGSVAHFQICGTLSCMITGAEDLMAICKERIAPTPHTLSADGRFSWEEVECLGACANAPMAQIGKDYYEDLSPEAFIALLDEFDAGRVPVPGPQNGRYASEPLSGLTSLTDHESGRTQYNASVARALELGDTIKRIDGTEVTLNAPWQGGAKTAPKAQAKPRKAAAKSVPAQTARPVGNKAAKPTRKPATKKAAKPEAGAGATRPERLQAARDGGADDLKQIKGVGPKMEALLNKLGFFHFDQIAKWTGAEVAWVDENLEGFKGRVSRDEWVKQAKVLAQGGTTEFAKKVKKGDVY